MSDFQRATVRVGYAGLNGTGVTGPEKTDIFDRLTDLEALTPPTVLDDLTDVDTTTNAPATGDLFQYDGTDWVPYTPEAITVTTAATYTLDGGGSTLTTGVHGDILVPFAGTITGYTLLPDQSGSLSIGVWKDSYANYPPVVGDLLLTLTLTATTKAQVTGLSHAVAAGDILRFNLTSVTSVTRVSIVLTMTREVGP